MSRTKINFLLSLALVTLIAFTVAVAVNDINSGIYADAHQLDGSSVGWFAPNGVLVFILSAVATLAYGIFLLRRFIGERQA